MEYLNKIRQMAEGNVLESPPRLSGECAGLQFCLPGYEYSLGGMFEAIDRMRSGTLDRAYCFGLPGHHAHRDWGHGYCLLHAQAAAVRYAQSCGLNRVLILDWDIHHGDGTQAIFAHDPSVYCLSIHSGLDLYMMKASKLEAGTVAAGQAVGHCNIPLVHSLFTDDWLARELPFIDRFYRAAQSLPVLTDALSRLPWKPDLVCICSGYDSHGGDAAMRLPTGRMKISNT
jgi:acetoin utilization deacetylase AcuC-like enzyme